MARLPFPDDSAQPDPKERESEPRPTGEGGASSPAGSGQAGASRSEGKDARQLEQARARRFERADLVRAVMCRRHEHSGEYSEDVTAVPRLLPEVTAAGDVVPAAAQAAPEAAAETRLPSTVPIDAAIPAALTILEQWWDADRREREELRRRLDAEPLARKKAKLDTRSDLDRALDSSDGAAFLRGLIDDVIRPDDLLASGFGLSDLADAIPDTLSPATKRAFRLAAFSGPGIPFITVPVMRRAVTNMFGRAVTPAGTEQLARAIGTVTAQNSDVRVRPLTDPVLGDRAAEAARRRVRELLTNPRIQEVELDWNTLEPRPCDWDFAGTAQRAAGQLATLLAYAREQAHQPLLTLRATTSRNTELAVETLLNALESGLALGARAGICLPADLPESTTLLRRIAGRAHLLREEGGMPIRVGIHRMTNRLRERADALHFGWKLASYATEQDVDASVVRLIDDVLASEHRGVLELAIDSTVPMDAALAASLATARESLAQVSLIVNHGTDAQLISRLRATGARVVERIAQLPEGTGPRPAAAYLRGIVANLDRQHEELLHAEKRSAPSQQLAPQQERLLAACARMHQIPAGQLRQQHRVEPEDAPGVTAAIKLELFPKGLFADEPEEQDPSPLADLVAAVDEQPTVLLGKRVADDTDSGNPPADEHPAPDGEQTPTATNPETANPEANNPAETGAVPNLTEVVLGLRRGRILRNTFRNDPPSDPTIAQVRDWANHIQRRAQRSEVGVDEAAAHQLHSAEQIDELIGRAHAAGTQWRQTTGWERAASLEQIAKAIEANRARLIEVAMAETGLAFAEIDDDISHAIDLMNYDAHLARQLDRMQGAEFEPVAVSLGVPGWIMPVSSTTSVIAATLAAGSAVIVKPSPRTERTAAVLARVIWATDLADGLLQLAGNDYQRLTDEQLGRELIVDSRVERVLMHGTYSTASHFLEWRTDLPLVGASGGKNSVIVTPAADFDQAARDIAVSVVTAAGQHPLRPSTAILVGSAAFRGRFSQQLADAVASTRVGYPADPSVHAGPLVARATGRSYEMLTELAEGERWLVAPRSLDDTGRLWTPGVRTGVKLSSPQLRNDAPVPVINIVHAENLDAAIDLQNSIDYGHGAGLFSLDRTEIAHWVQRVEAGNLFVNRDVIDCRVQRQPSGGWKRSMIGTKLKSGGPNTLLHLGRWRPAEQTQSHTLHLRGLEEPTRRLIEALQPSLSFDEFERLRRCALSCQVAWNEQFGEVIDVTNLPTERNLLRYRPVDCLIRASSDATITDLGQVLAAASAARARLLLSCAIELPELLQREITGRGGTIWCESDEAFLQRMHSQGLREARRLRLLGGSRSELFGALKNAVDVAVFSDDVTLAGRLEMLPFLREQAISITAHRFGYRDERVFNLFPHEVAVDTGASVLAAAAALQAPPV